MRVRWTREAQAQFRNQHRYLRERSQRAADRLVEDIDAAEALIARNPEFGRRLDGLSPDMREWGIGREKRFVFRYLIGTVVITIVQFWHTAQQRPFVV